MRAYAHQEQEIQQKKTWRSRQARAVLIVSEWTDAQTEKHHVPQLSYVGRIYNQTVCRTKRINSVSIKEKDNHQQVEESKSAKTWRISKMI